MKKNVFISETPSEILNSFYTSPKDKHNSLKTLNDLANLSAIVVIDQELRGEDIKGIDISTKLKEYYPASYISMLTSNVTNNTAIELHNNHHIDLFVDKKDSNAIHSLYTYLFNHINGLKKEYEIDSLDVFENAGNLTDTEYQLNKRNLIENNNPLSFLTLNEQGDIAIMHETKNISYWQFNPNTKQFTEYE